MPVEDRSEAVLARVLALLRRHGRAALSFQALEPGLRYWFDDAGEACVAFADTGRAWVAAGPPIAAPDREPAICRQFTADARSARRRVRWFGLESRPAGDLAALHIGEQPVWDPARWCERVRGKRSLREQLRRARAAGVTVRQADSAALACGGDRPAIERLIARWLARRSLPPMAFVVRIDIFGFAREKRIYLAERAGAVVGVLAAAPIYAAHTWFFEDVLRDPEAPNGTVELMIDHAMRDLADVRAMRDLADAGAPRVTYGLAPLAGTPSRLLRVIRKLSKPLYNFDGLRRFKDKLGPDAWHPVYLGFPVPARGRHVPIVSRVVHFARVVRAVLDVLRAFAGGGLLRFGLATLRHRVRRPKKLRRARRSAPRRLARGRES